MSKMLVREVAMAGKFRTSKRSKYPVYHWQKVRDDVAKGSSVAAGGEHEK
jgi:hypothetical protein